MKARTTLLTFAVFAMFLMSPFAFAEDSVIASDTSTEIAAAEDAAGITPDSALYVVDTVADDISLALTFDEAAQAEKAVEIADERLAETEVMAEEGNLEAVDEAQEQHDEAISTAEEAVAEIETDGDADGNLEAVQNVEQIRERIMSHSEKVASVKNRILERKRATMTPEQIAHLEAVFGKIIAKAQDMETKTEQKRENAKAKYKAMTGKTDAEVESDLEQVRAGKKVENKVRTANTGEDSELQTQTSEQTGSAEDASGPETAESDAGAGNGADNGEQATLGNGEAIQLN